VITRNVLADVCGHGASAAEFSLSLRSLLGKNINNKSQKRLVEQLNRQFTEMTGLQRFATALVATYLAPKDRLSLCNAGHPRPMHFRARLAIWSLLEGNVNDGNGSNLPLRLDETTMYQTFDIALGLDDVILFNTDALTEATDSAGKLLGEAGFLEAARGLELSDTLPSAIESALLDAVADYQQHRRSDDDVTLIAVHHNASPSPRLSLLQKLHIYAKVFGLKSV
jgi:sigma-B regulation protein RsbU (phosphoserine phosphatase)